MKASKATVVIMALILMAGVVSAGCGSQPEIPSKAALRSPAAAGQPSQLCVPGIVQPSVRFGQLRGWITYSDWSRVWAMDPEHPATRIYLGPSNGMSSIAWSRDGTHMLLLEQGRSGDATIQDLCVVSADGSLIPLTIGGTGGQASFSPDATKVVFARNEGLYVVGETGGTPRLIARSYMSWWLGAPAWSPDGSRIAYTVYLAGGPDPGVEIWTVNPDGTDPRPLLNLGSCRASCGRHLAWSPDGSMLAFDSAYTNRGLSLQWAIYVVHADGSGLRRINERGASPSWSPDGSRLAFIRIDSTSPPTVWDYEMDTMAPDGSNLTAVADVRADPFFGLAWNPEP